MAAGDATYATKAELQAYIEGITLPATDPLIQALLQRAERDIDLAVGALVYEANGLKYGSPKTANEKHLLPEQVRALSNATCAQAEYRLSLGPDFFRKPRNKREKGPDFEVEIGGDVGAPPRLAPKARAELIDGGLLFLTGRARAGGAVTPRRRYSPFLDATRHDGT